MVGTYSAHACMLLRRARRPRKNDIYFFGDSTTAHLAVRGGIPRERVWSGQARTVLFETVNKTRCVWLEAENRNYKIADAAAKVKPPILVITLGVSGGAGRLGEQRFKSIYRELIVSVREASPETHIFVQSILPLSDRTPRNTDCSQGCRAPRKHMDTGALPRARRTVYRYASDSARFKRLSQENIPERRSYASDAGGVFGRAGKYIQLYIIGIIRL